MTFEHEGKTYPGYLSAVSGSGGNIYHLMVQGYDKGQLIRTGAMGLVVSFAAGKGKELSEELGRVVEGA